MKVKEESEKVGLKLNIQKTKIMASVPITSWQIDGETIETMSMNKLVDHIFVFEGDGKIKDYYGNYTEYRQMKDKEMRIQKRIEKANRPVEEKAVREAPKNKLTYKEKRELESLETEIEALEQEKSDIEGKMSAGQGTANEFAEWGRRYAEIKTVLEEKSNRWLELSEKEA